jgi:hypothetical protein
LLLGFDDIRGDAELALRVEPALVGQSVEALVVQAADVGDQTDLEAGSANAERATAGGHENGDERDG